MSHSKENENNIRALIAERAPTVFAYQALSYSKHLIEEETDKGVLPPNIKDVFLQDLLERGVCICGRDLNEDEECRKNVEGLLATLMPNDVSIDATSVKYAIDNMIKKAEFLDKYKKYLETRQGCDIDREELADKIEKETDRLSKYNVEEIREKNEKRDKLWSEYTQLNVRKGTLGNKIIHMENENKGIEEIINSAARKEIITKHLQEQKDYAEYIKNLMIEIKESIVDEVRSLLEKRTKEYFFNMIWKKEAFSDVRIVDTGNQYKISVKSEFGRECLGDLSAGERQVLALSFTAALYSISGYSVPVIIDTPLGRISGAPRDNIAASLPSYLSETQVIMLATDTEYTESVREKLKNSVGAEYKIKHNEELKTSKVVCYE